MKCKCGQCAWDEDCDINKENESPLNTIFGNPSDLAYPRLLFLSLVGLCFSFLISGLLPKNGFYYLAIFNLILGMIGIFGLPFSLSVVSGKKGEKDV